MHPPWVELLSPYSVTLKFLLCDSGCRAPLRSLPSHRRSAHAGRAISATRRHGAGDDIVPVIQLTVEHLHNLGNRMVRDACAHSNRFEGFVRTQLPYDSHVHSRAARLRLGVSLSSP